MVMQLGLCKSHSFYHTWSHVTNLTTLTGWDRGPHMLNVRPWRAQFDAEKARTINVMLGFDVLDFFLMEFERQGIMQSHNSQVRSVVLRRLPNQKKRITQLDDERSL